MCDKERYYLVSQLEAAVENVTLWHKRTDDMAFNFAVDSLVRRFGRLKAHEERTKSDK
jgi:hypothetical protein